MHSYCLRCGRDLVPGRGHCDKCGARMWTGPRLPVFTKTLGWIRLTRYRVRLHLHRDGERQISLMSLPTAGVFAVDRLSSLGNEVILRLTDRRLTVYGPLGSADLSLSTIRQTRTFREWSEDRGYCYWVAVDLQNGQHIDAHGDMCLWCVDQRQSEVIAAAIAECASQATHRAES
jgi:hypothetical protein